MRPLLLSTIIALASACSAPAAPETSSGSGGMSPGGAGNAGNAGEPSSGGSSAGSAGGSSGGGAMTGGVGGSGGGGGASAGAGSGGNGGTQTQIPDYVPAGYTLQFEESFAEPASLDLLVFANPDEWAHSSLDGGYLESTGFSYAPPYYSPHSLAVVAGMTFGSFVLEVELEQTSMTGGHRDFCLVWGMQSPSRYYYAHIGQAHDSASHNIHLVSDADRTPITEIFTDGFDWGTGWKKFRLVRDVESGAMAVYAGDSAEPILTATDETLGAGYVGFGSFDDTGRVRNARIYAASLETHAEQAAFFTAK
jgi:hypothetical protein